MWSNILPRGRTGRGLVSFPTFPRKIWWPAPLIHKPSWLNMKSGQFSNAIPKKWPSVTQEAKSVLWISSSVISYRLHPCGTYQKNVFCVVISICFSLRPNASEWLYTDITLQTLQQEWYLPWLVPCLWSHWSSPLLEQLNRNMKKGSSILQNFPWIQISFISRVCHSSWVGPGFLFIWLYIQWDPFLPFLWLCGNGQVSLT